MEDRGRDIQIELAIRRTLLRRLWGHWVLFFGLTILLVSVLEFLFGELQRLSFDVIGQAVGKHAVMIAALLVMIPISIRDCIRCVQRAVRIASPESAAAKSGEVGIQSTVEPAESKAESPSEPSEFSVTNQNESQLQELEPVNV